MHVRLLAAEMYFQTIQQYICWLITLCLFCICINQIIICSLKGHELLSELQQRRFNGSDGGVSWSPMDDELLAQPQVMKLLDSLREQYTRYQEVCRQRSKRTQLEEIQQKVMQVRIKFLNAVRSRFGLKTQPLFSSYSWSFSALVWLDALCFGYWHRLSKVSSDTIEVIRIYSAPPAFISIAKNLHHIPLLLAATASS